MTIRIFEKFFIEHARNAASRILETGNAVCAEDGCTYSYRVSTLKIHYEFQS